jgi:hypothetical protein
VSSGNIQWQLVAYSEILECALSNNYWNCKYERRDSNQGGVKLVESACVDLALMVDMAGVSGY